MTDPSEGVRPKSSESRNPLGRIFDWLFGYDYFLAHRSADGKIYAARLFEALTARGNGLDCFLDVKHYGAGHSLTALQTRALKKTTRLIVIVTPESHDAEALYLRGEVEEFKARHPLGLIVPIGTEATLSREKNAGSLLLPLLPGLPDDICVLESEAALLSGTPSSGTVSKLLNDFREERRSVRRIGWIQRVAVALLLLLISTCWFWRESEKQRGEAEKSAAEAKVQEGKAKDSAAEALGQQRMAEKSAAEAKVQEGKAKDSAAEALRQQRMAELSAKEANIRLADTAWQLGSQARGAPFSTAQLSPVAATWHLLDAAEALEKAKEPDAAETALFAADFAARPLLAADVLGQAEEEQGAADPENPDSREPDIDVAGLWHANDSGIAADLGNGGPGEGSFYSNDQRLSLQQQDDGTVVQMDSQTLKPFGKAMRPAEYQPGDPQIQAGTDEQNEGGKLHMVYGVDGSRVLMWGIGKTVRLWAAATGEPTGKTMAHEGSVAGLLQRADGQRILTWTYGGLIRQWYAKSGEPMGRPLKMEGEVEKVCYSRDGLRILALNKEGTLCLWSSGTGERLGAAIHHPGMKNAMLSDDEKRIVTWGDSTVAQWDMKSGGQIGNMIGLSEVERQPEEDGDKEFGLVASVEYSHDGRRIVTRTSYEAQLWDAEDLTPIGPPLLHPGRLNGATFSPDSKLLLTWGEIDTVRLWDAETGEAAKMVIDQPVETGGGDYEQIKACFSADGQQVITAGKGCVRVWALKQPGESLVLTQESGVKGGAFSGDGTKIAIWNGDFTVQQWDCPGGAKIGVAMKHSATVNGAAYSPDNHTILTWSDDGTSCQWDARDGGRLLPAMRHAVDAKDPRFSDMEKEEREESMRKAAAIKGACYDDTGTRILTWCGGGSAQLWDSKKASMIGTAIKDEKKIEGERVVFGISGGSFKKGGKIFLTWDAEGGNIHQWEAATQRPSGPAMMLGDFGCGVVYSPDGSRILAPWADGEVRQWNSSDGSSFGKTLMHEEVVIGAIYSPDGERALTWCRNGKVRQWDVETGTLYGRTLEHPDGHRSEPENPGMAYSPDGRWIMTWGGSMAVLWSARDSYVAACFPHEGIVSACFDPQGRRVLTTGGKEAKLWDLSFDKTRSAAARRLEFEVRSGSKTAADGSQEILSRKEWLAKLKEWQQGLPGKR